MYVARPGGDQPTRSRAARSPGISGGMPKLAAEEMGSTKVSMVESGTDVSGVGGGISVWTGAGAGAEAGASVGDDDEGLEDQKYVRVEKLPDSNTLALGLTCRVYRLKYTLHRN